MWMVIVTMHTMNNIKHIKVYSVSVHRIEEVHKVYEFKCHAILSQPCKIIFIQGSFKKVGNLETDAKSFILTSMYT
jgi:hypothetical protein